MTLMHGTFVCSLWLDSLSVTCEGSQGHPAPAGIREGALRIPSNPTLLLACSCLLMRV